MQEKLSTLFQSDYFTTIFFIFLMVIVGLSYLLLRYKKSLKEYSLELAKKDEKIKMLRQYAYEAEVKRAEKEHAVEKEILTLKHKLKTVEIAQKEGLKSQVASMIERYEKKRATMLERANIMDNQKR